MHFLAVKIIHVQSVSVAFSSTHSTTPITPPQVTTHLHDEFAQRGLPGAMIGGQRGERKTVPEESGETGA